MSTFDEILPKLTEVFARHRAEAARIAPVLVNRDLNERVRLIVNENWQGDDRAMVLLNKIADEIHEELGPHAYTVDQSLLFEPDIQDEMTRGGAFPLEGTNS